VYHVKAAWCPLFGIFTSGSRSYHSYNKNLSENTKKVMRNDTFVWYFGYHVKAGNYIQECWTQKPLTEHWFLQLWYWFIDCPRFILRLSYCYAARRYSEIILLWFGFDFVLSSLAAHIKKWNKHQPLCRDQQHNKCTKKQNMNKP
jgi:hypothetical protein